MKRFLAMLLASLMLVSLVSATEDAEKTQTAVINFTDVEALMRENNPTIKSNAQNLILAQNPPIPSSATDGLFDLANSVSLLNQSIKGSIAALETISGSDSSPTDNLQTNSIILALTATSLNLDMLSMDISSQISQFNTGNSADDLETQLAIVDNQLIIGAEALFTAYATMEIQKSELLLSYDSLSRNIASLEKRYELGQISKLDLLTAQNGLLSLSSGMKSLDFEMQNIREQLNIMLGYDFTSSLALSKIPSVDASLISAINLTEDTKTAMENSYSLEQKQDDKDDAYKGLGKHEGPGDEANYEVATIALEQEEIKINQTMSKLDRTITEKQRLLAFEQENLAHKKLELDASSLKFSRGMISELEHLTVQNDYESQENKVALAEIEIRTAYSQYEWAKKGILPN